MDVDQRRTALAVDEPGDEAPYTRCAALTRRGTACRGRPGASGYCPRHAPDPARDVDGPATVFYARRLDQEGQDDFAAAAAQEGLGGEVAVLRLHLLRLIGDDPSRWGEIPRVVHALVRALHEQRGRGDDARAEWDALVREEGRRLLARDVPPNY